MKLPLCVALLALQLLAENNTASVQQTALGALPEFEAASVTAGHPPGRARGGGGGSWGMKNDPGMLRASNFTLRRLVQYAYDLQDRQVSGPSWIDSETYDVTGKAGDKAGGQDLRLMLRSLLSGRFQLKLHWETKVMPVYYLVVSPRGSKLKEVTSGDIRKPGLLGKTTMENFAKMMVGSSTTEFAPAIDRTGLKGDYDLTVLESAKSEEPGTTFVDAWIEAMPRQVGLELKRDKADMQILIIDHAEKIPTAN